MGNFYIKILKIFGHKIQVGDPNPPPTPPTPYSTPYN